MTIKVKSNLQKLAYFKKNVVNFPPGLLSYGVTSLMKIQFFPPLRAILRNFIQRFMSLSMPLKVCKLKFTNISNAQNHEIKTRKIVSIQLSTIV